MRSFATAALCLALLQSTDARIPRSFRNLSPRDAQPGAQSREGILGWFSRLLKRELQPRQGSTCYEDAYYDFVGSDALGQGFCQDYMDYPNRTVPVEATATSTLTTTYTTSVNTFTEYTITTPGSTVTATVTAGAAKVKRDDDAQITARAALRRYDAFSMFRRQTNTTDGDEAMAESFSSACNCHNYAGPVVSSTYTGQTTVRTVRAFGDADTTTTQVRTAPASVATTTTTVAGEAPPPSAITLSSTPTSSAAVIEEPSTTDSNPSNPTPTAPAYTCPEDNNTTVSQMVGSERFDYLVLCDTTLFEADIYNGALTYRSFSECVGACSIVDQQFDDPVCQGVSFQATNTDGSGTCFLKSSANHTVMATGIDSALLQRIAVGIANDTMQGTATESLPFAGQQTAKPSQINSMVSSIVANSTHSMPMVTPVGQPVMSGRQVGDGTTAYSTYVSDGSTYSSGTGYTFATTYANGSWVSAYYTSYTLTWASATTVYGEVPTGLSYENSTNTNSYQTNGANGQYGIVTWTNTTYGNGSTQDVIQTVSYDADGSQFFSTATTYSTAATGSAGGAGGAGISGPVSTSAGPLVTSVTSNGGSGSGGAAGGAAGGPGSGGPSTTPSRSLVFSTQTVFSSAGGTGYAESGNGAGGPPVTYTYVSTLVTNGSTAYSTYFVISGGAQGTGFETGGIASGGPSSTPALTPITVISTAGQTQGGSVIYASGGPGNTGGASSGIVSGGPSSSPTAPVLSLVTVITNSGATGGASSGGANGGPGATGGASSGLISGGPAPSSSSRSLSFTNSGGNRSPGQEDSTTSAPLLTVPSGYGPPSSADTFTGSAPPVNATQTPSVSPSSGLLTALSRSGTFETATAPTSPPIFTAPSGGFYSPPGIPGTSPPGTAPASSGTAASSRGTYTAPNDSRFPGTESSTGTAPLGTGSSPLGTATGPVGTSPVGTGTAPAGTSPGTYSAPNDSRFPGTESSSTSPPLGTGLTGYQPPPPLSAPSGSAPSGSLPGTAPNTAPSSGFLPSTGSAPSSGFPASTGSLPSTGFPLPTGYTGSIPFATAPTAPASSGTAPTTSRSFTNSNDSRFPGTESSTGTMPHSYPSMTFPTAQSSCVNGTMGTVTMFQTVTEYGCYSSCAPQWGGWGGYGGPHPFGPPATTAAEPEETGS